MNVFHKIALQDLKQNKSRTFVTIIGVILSTALITAITTFAVSLQNYVINGAIKKYSDWHIAFTDVPSSFVQEQVRDKRVDRVVFYENIGYAMLDGGVNEYKPYLFIAGLDQECLDALPVNLLSGRLPESSGEVIVPAHVASNGGVKFSIGDTLVLDVGQRSPDGQSLNAQHTNTDGDNTANQQALNQHDPYRTGDLGGETLIPTGEKTYTVVGFYQRPAFEERFAPGYTLITAAEDTLSAHSLTAFVTLKEPYQLRSYREDVKGGDSMLNDNVLRFMGLSDDTLFNTLLYSTGGILVLLIMIGSIFMIYNAFNISLNERTHQFGIFLSVGATEKQLRSSVLFEGICIGAAGIPLGMLLALPGIQLILTIVEKNFRNILYSDVPLSLVISPVILVGAVVISMVTILISAYLPAKKAARTPVMECIRQTGEIKVGEKDVKISKLTERIYELEGVLALKNFKRNKGRYRSIVLSLTFSVVLFVSCSAFGLYMQMEAAGTIVDVDYDLSFSAKDMEEEEFFMLYDNLKNVDGVYESSWHTVDSDETLMWEIIFRSTNPGQSKTQMKEIIEGAGIVSGYSLENYHELLEQNRNLLFIVNLFTVVFSGMIALIAVANVFNTISTNIRQRKRELAMIRSIGMSDRDFNKMMGFECIFYGMQTLVISLPLSVIFSFLIYHGIAGGRIGGAEGFTFILPLSSIAVSLCGVFLVIFIATLYTVSRIKKENIIDALRDDMV